jgi:hypothetical protein
MRRLEKGLNRHWIEWNSDCSLDGAPRGMALDSLSSVRWITTGSVANHRLFPISRVKIELNSALFLLERSWILSATGRVKFRTHAENYAIPHDQRGRFRFRH